MRCRHEGIVRVGRSELEIGARDNVSGTGLERGKTRGEEEGPIGRNGARFGTGGREKERRRRRDGMPRYGNATSGGEREIWRWGVGRGGEMGGEMESTACDSDD